MPKRTGKPKPVNPGSAIDLQNGNRVELIPAKGAYVLRLYHRSGRAEVRTTIALSKPATWAVGALITSAAVKDSGRTKLRVAQ